MGEHEDEGNAGQEIGGQADLNHVDDLGGGGERPELPQPLPPDIGEGGERPDLP